jgi:hypothetical protein
VRDAQTPAPKVEVNPNYVESVEEEIRRRQQDHLERDKERKLREKLAIKVIDDGFKLQAMQLHPDKEGGSEKAMKRLNDVRIRLRQFI